MFFPANEAGRSVETIMLRTPNVGELWVYGARLWDYLVPSVLHPIFKQYVSSFTYSHLHQSNPVEQNLFLGYIPLFLALLLIYLKRSQGSLRVERSGKAERELMIIPLFLASFLVAVLLSFPPMIVRVIIQ